MSQRQVDEAAERMNRALKDMARAYARPLLRSPHTRPSRLQEAWASIYCMGASTFAYTRAHAGDFLYDLMAFTGIIAWFIFLVLLYNALQ